MWTINLFECFLFDATPLEGCFFQTISNNIKHFQPISNNFVIFAI